MNKKNSFKCTDTNHKKIWEILIKRDITAFVKSKWSDIENDFAKNKFLGIHANFSFDPSKWTLSFSALDDYRKVWLQQSYSAKKNYAEPIEEALHRVSSIGSIKTDKGNVAVLKKFNGTIKKRRGKSDVLKWQTLYFCQLIKNKWKITGFVGYLPLE